METIGKNPKKDSAGFLNQVPILVVSPRFGFRVQAWALRISATKRFRGSGFRV